jgi:hypothetical protein
MVMMSGTTFQCSTANHLPVLAKATHDFVTNQHDAVFVTELAQALHVAFGGMMMPLVPTTDSTMMAATVCAFKHDDIFDAVEAVEGTATFAATKTTAVAVGVWRTHYAGDTGLSAPATGVAGQRDGTGGGAVIRAVAGDDFVAAGEGASDFDGVFVGFSATIGKRLCSDCPG